MKKCDWCGAEYPDTTEKCTVDGLPLGGTGAPPACSGIGSAAVPPIISVTADPELLVAGVPTATGEKRLRVFELVLVCAIAFGGSILYSVSLLFTPAWRNSGSGTLRWVHSGLMELSALALLWYVLARRSGSFRDLGLYYRKQDLGWSVVVWLLGSVAFSLVYAGVYLTDYVSGTKSEATARVARLLFGGGISAVTIAFQFLNPFFEELIVRAYVMTEVRHLTGSIALAVTASTLLQMSYHFYQGVPLALAEGAMFLVFSLYYARTGRITPVILAHFYLDIVPTLQAWLAQR